MQFIINVTNDPMIISIYNYEVSAIKYLQVSTIYYDPLNVNVYK